MVQEYNNEVRKYRKKPVIIEAVQFKICGEIPALKFLGLDQQQGLHRENDVAEFYSYRQDSSILRIKTLEGVMEVSDGDYIIKGVNGEFYPCKPDIFEKTYEKVEE